MQYFFFYFKLQIFLNLAIYKTNFLKLNKMKLFHSFPIFLDIPAFLITWEMLKGPICSPLTGTGSFSVTMVVLTVILCDFKGTCF